MLRMKPREKEPEELIQAANRALHGYPDGHPEREKIRIFKQEQQARIPGNVKKIC